MRTVDIHVHGLARETDPDLHRRHCLAEGRITQGEQRRKRKTQQSHHFALSIAFCTARANNTASISDRYS
jgi:hypothetical protein